MDDMWAIADAFVRRIRTRLPDDVAIVFAYGSQARGTAHPDSDLDLCLIPATEQGAAAAISFVLDGIGYDFWAISWERAERIASLQEAIFPIILESRVLFSRSESDLARFEGLRSRIRSFAAPGGERALVEKTLACFSKSFVRLYHLGGSVHRGESLPARVELARLVSTITDTLAMIRFGQSSGLMVSAIHHAATAIDDSIDELILETRLPEILTGAEALVEATRQLLVELYGRYAGSVPLTASLRGYYEEARSSFLKIARACRASDRRAAFLHSMRLQLELGRAMAESRGALLPSDLYGFSDCLQTECRPPLPVIRGSVGNLERYADQVAAFEESLKKLLKTNDIPIRVYRSREELEKALDGDSAQPRIP